MGFALTDGSIGGKFPKDSDPMGGNWLLVIREDQLTELAQSIFRERLWVFLCSECRGHTGAGINVFEDIVRRYFQAGLDLGFQSEADMALFLIYMFIGKNNIHSNDLGIKIIDNSILIDDRRYMMKAFLHRQKILYWGSHESIY